MRAGVKCSLALVFGLHAIQAESGERLGGISDETAPPVHQAEPEADREGSIVYRVICSPEGEMLPECSQPPVSDSFKATQPPQTGPVVPDMPGGVDEKEDAGEEQGEQPAKALESGASKKAAAHKKPSKKPVKKSAKKTPKPVKRKGR
ncbi:MAG: hypothetical protein LUQ11_09380 [Methylococcaceae bacterium]|nr:hypothetical protein [Methylococcaceae bacterium]